MKSVRQRQLLVCGCREWLWALCSVERVSGWPSTGCKRAAGGSWPLVLHPVTRRLKSTLSLCFGSSADLSLPELCGGLLQESWVCSSQYSLGEFYSRSSYASACSSCNSDTGVSSCFYAASVWHLFERCTRGCSRLLWDVCGVCWVRMFFSMSPPSGWSCV